MGVYSGPEIANDGLVLSLDAANLKGYDKYENFLTYSEDFSNVAWGKSNVSVTANQGIAPDGTLTADLVTTNTVSAYNTLEQFPTLSTNTNYCYSVFVKLVSGSGTSSRVVFGSANDQVSPVYASWGLQLDTLAETSDGNTPTVKGYIPYPNGWYRLYMVINTSLQTNANVSIRFGTGGADTVNTFYVWGAQLEKGSSVTDYYPTTATTKTRGSTLIDLSGRGNNGTLTNGPTFSTANSGSIVFDGTNDYVSLPTNLINWDTGNPLTISVWFKTSSTGIILGQQNNPTPNSASGYIPAIYVDTNGLLRTTCFYSGFIQTSVSSSAVNNGAWNNITATFSSGTQTSYLNGISYATLSQTQQSYSATYYYFLGSGQGTNWTNFPASPYLNGSISNFSYYNRALTAAEIQQNYNATKSRYGL